MKHLFFLLIATVGLIFNTSCSSPKPDTGKPAVITVTIEPLRYFTEAIAGDKFDIVSMVPDGSSPETYDPTPQQLVALAQSKAYFQIGHIGFEQTWMQRLQANAPHLLFYDMSENVPLMEGTCHETHQHNHDHNVDPHIWNSTKNAEIIVKNIYHALCQLDSIHQAYYAHRLDSVTTLIRETEKQVQAFKPRCRPHVSYLSSGTDIFCQRLQPAANQYREQWKRTDSGSFAVTDTCQ